MKKTPLAVVMCSLVTVLGVVTVGARQDPAQAALTPLLPNLRGLIPTQSMVIDHPTSTTKELSYTHIIYNAGGGPLELQPTYNSATDTASATQRLYGRDGTGALVPVQDIAIQGQFFWHAPHGHYHFPAADFGLYGVAADGSRGAVVSMSPKLGFCMADSHEIDPTLPGFSSTKAYSGGACQDPTSKVGISPGWGDEYTPADVGQSIDITAVPDGDYWFVSRIDPSNYLIDADRSDNDMRVKLHISGDRVTVESPLLPTGPLVVDRQWSTNGKGTVASAPISTAQPGELLVATVTTDGPRSSAQTAVVSGGGLTWSRVAQANAVAGDTEVWQATAPTALSGVAVTSSPGVGGYDQSLVVNAFRGAAGVGASAFASSASGSPSMSLTTTSAGSYVFGAGNDWDRSVYRTPAPGQTLVHQWVDEVAPNYTNGDTLWVQATTTPVTGAGTTVTVADSAPIGDRWNAVAVEVKAVTAPPSDVTPPAISGVNASSVTPTGATIGWATNEPSSSRVDYGLTPAYGTSTSTDATLRTAHSQQLLGLIPSTTYHARVASTDAAGNTAISGDLTFTTPAMPPMPLAIDRTMTVQGRGVTTTPQFSTAVPGEVLVAFVATDGWSGAAQSATVSGGGLTWRRVKLQNFRAGAADVWTATATTVASNITVTSTPTGCCLDQLLTVIAFSGSGGVGASAGSSASTGAPAVALTPTVAGSWVFGVANDWDRAVARTPMAGQSIVQQWVDVPSGDTLWLQRLDGSTTGSIVVLKDTAPTNDRWNLTVVEIKPSP
jgi:hypothetical protein